jgi:hypothetical protein
MDELVTEAQSWLREHDQREGKDWRRPAERTCAFCGRPLQRGERCSCPEELGEMTVHPDARVIVRWSDADGPKEVIFGPEIPWEARARILAMSNDDWGEILIQNPLALDQLPEVWAEPFLWCSARPEHREAARRAMGTLDAYMRNLYPLGHITAAEIAANARRNAE